MQKEAHKEEAVLDTEILSIFMTSTVSYYLRKRAPLEDRLRSIGRRIGSKVLFLMEEHESSGIRGAFGGGGTIRENTLLGAGKFIATRLWPFLFGKKIDTYGLSSRSDNRLILTDKNSLLSKNYWECSDTEGFNGNILACGVIERVMEGWGFRVQAHCYSKSDAPEVKDSLSNRTVFVVLWEQAE